MKLLLLTVLVTLQGVPSAPTQVGPTFVRIRGRVTSMPAGIPAGLLTIRLLSPGAVASDAPEAPVQPDGTFEFARVAADSYTIGLRRVTMLSTVVGRIQADKDITNLEIAAPPMITGRVVVDDGSPVPVQMLKSGCGRQEVRSLWSRRWRGAMAPLRPCGWDRTHGLN
jgi:hypothetical protein